MSDTWIILATYNERANLPRMVHRVCSLKLDASILVVDDNSPDGTGDIADDLSRQYPGLSVIHRRQRTGLSAALVDGFRWVLDRGGRWILNLDADLSHSPEAIPLFLGMRNEADLVVGCRFATRPASSHWPIHRMLLSKGASIYLRCLTGIPVQDPTSGFRLYERETLLGILSEPVVSRGFAFHFECTHKAWLAGRRIAEVPITFARRASGSSKLRLRILVEGIYVGLKLSVRLPFRSKQSRETQTTTPPRGFKYRPKNQLAEQPEL